jgi:hypothetical protein
MSSCGDSCSTYCPAALCGFVSAASSRTGGAANYCRSADNFFTLPRHRRVQQHRMLPAPMLQAHGSVHIVAEPWSSSKSSLRNKCFGDLFGGRASLILRSSHSSSNRSLAAARQPDLCSPCVGSPKTDDNPARKTILFLIVRLSPMSNGGLHLIDGYRFGKPELPPSIEYP